MRDYEMVELKLLVAVEEGASARGISVSDGTFRIERLMPGLYVLGVPTALGNVPVVVLTDHFDLGLLGFAPGAHDAALLIHDLDLESMQQAGLEFDRSAFQQREPLPGWNFTAFPWADTAQVDRALQGLIPAYRAEELPQKLPIDH